MLKHSFLHYCVQVSYVASKEYFKHLNRKKRLAELTLIRLQEASDHEYLIEKSTA